MGCTNESLKGRTTQSIDLHSKLEADWLEEGRLEDDWTNHVSTEIDSMGTDNDA